MTNVIPFSKPREPFHSHENDWLDLLAAISEQEPASFDSSGIGRPVGHPHPVSAFNNKCAPRACGCQIRVWAQSLARTLWDRSTAACGA